MLRDDEREVIKGAMDLIESCSSGSEAIRSAPQEAGFSSWLDCLSAYRVVSLAMIRYRLVSDEAGISQVLKEVRRILADVQAGKASLEVLPAIQLFRALGKMYSETVRRPVSLAPQNLPLGSRLMCQSR
jgi:hypothetical protein